MLEFWLDLCLRAFWASIYTIGQTEGSLLFGVLAIAIGAVWVLHKEGWHAMKSTIIQAIIGAPLIVWLGFFLFYLFIQTPYVRFDEERQRANSAQQLVKEKNKTIDAQKETIQNLEVKLKEQLKVLQQPLRIGHYSLGPMPTREKQSAAAHDFVVYTNAMISPVRLAVNCDSDIADAYMRMLGIKTLMLGELGRINTRQYEINISAPAWGPMTPLLVTLYSNQKEMRCSFSRP